MAQNEAMKGRVRSQERRGEPLAHAVDADSHHFDEEQDPDLH